MEKLKLHELHMVTKITTSEDSEKTFSFEKELEDVNGKHGIFVLLYPTRNVENCHVEDSTNVHLLNHLKELNMASYTVINLFATVTKSKLSTRNLEVDEENLKYIATNIFEKIDNKNSDVIIAWGNSHLTSKVVNESKKRLLELWNQICGDRLLYQLTVSGMGKENVGVHPLYLGIRHSNAVWKLSNYPYKKVLKELSDKVSKGQ